MDILRLEVKNILKKKN